jgi:putative multiple sugar transport system substrate-binding protein
MVGNLQAGEEPEINDPDSYDNGVKTVPAYLLEPQIVTKENAAEAYKNDSTLSALTK